MRPQYSTPPIRSIDGCSTRKGYLSALLISWPLLQSPALTKPPLLQSTRYQNAPASVHRMSPYGYANHAPRPSADPSRSCPSLR